MTELRQLSLDDGRDVYDMLQEMPKEENGFVNGVNGISYEVFKQWLIHSDNASKGFGLEDWMVPQTTYWLYADGVPVGFGKLRHRLTDKLLQEGGHIGYAVRPSARGKGYGTLLLKLIVQKAREMGIGRLLVTVRSANLPSIRTALGNGGVIEKVADDRHYIWIE